MNVRVGIGFDIHRLHPGTHLKLGGVTIPFDRGLVGHSDGGSLLVNTDRCVATSGGAALARPPRRNDVTSGTPSAGSKNENVFSNQNALWLIRSSQRNHASLEDAGSVASSLGGSNFGAVGSS